MTSNRPSSPRAVARILRQEAGFGCAKCGHPYIEYHHIIPWSEERHFRSKDMVALCGNCHPAISRLDRDAQYAVKSSPYNVTNSTVSAPIFSKNKEIILRAGSNYFIDPMSIIRFHDTDILAIRGGENGVEVDITLLDERLNQLLIVRNNEILFRENDIWDFEYSHNRIVTRYAPRKIAMDLDFRDDVVEVKGTFQVGDALVSISEDTFQAFGIKAQNSTFMGFKAVIQYGDNNVPLPMRCKI